MIGRVSQVGDDLRQDCIVLEMIRIMDQLWLAEGLDFLMTPYHTAATWNNGGVLQVCSGVYSTCIVLAFTVPRAVLPRGLRCVVRARTLWLTASVVVCG